MATLLPRALCLACILVLLQASGNARAGSHPYHPYAFIQPEDLIQALDLGGLDLVLNTLENIEAMRYKGEILPLLLAMWHRDTAGYPHLNRPAAEQPIVRVRVALLLARSARSARMDLIDMDVKPLFDYLRQAASSEDAAVAEAALSALEQCNREEDVPFLLEEIRTRDGRVFEAAVRALDRMCNAAAWQATQELASGLGGQRREQFVHLLARKESFFVDLCRQRKTSASASHRCQIFLPDSLSGRVVSPQEMTRVLDSGDLDQAIEVFREIKGMPSDAKEEILAFVLTLWMKNRQRYPDLNWRVAEKPVIRVELADVLARAARNAEIDLDSEPLHAYLRQAMAGDDAFVVREALLGLALFDRKTDLPAIVLQATVSHGLHFGSAVQAVWSMCNDGVPQALRDLRENASGEQRDYVTSLLHEERQHGKECEERRKAVNARSEGAS